MIFEGLQMVQLDNIITKKSGSYQSIAFLNTKIKDFIDNYYGPYGFKYGINDTDINIKGIVLNSEYISKMVNNYTVFKSMIRLNGLKTEEEFYNYMYTNLREIYSVEGKYFKNTINILSNTIRLGNQNEIKAIAFFEKALENRGITIKVDKPTIEEDISGIDGKFTWKGKIITLQVKPYVSTLIRGDEIYIESQGSLSIGTDYLILYNLDSFIIVRGKDTKIVSKYFVCDLKNILEKPV